MTGNPERKIERSIDELYAQDPERADATVFGRQTGVDRRGFLGGAGLAAVSAAVGGAIPFASNMPGGLIPAALAQGAPAAPAVAKGPQYLKFPGKDDKLVLLGDRPLVAETPEHLLDDDTTPTSKFFVRNNGQIPDAAKEPDAWKMTVDGEVNNKLELTLGELKAKFKPVTQRMVLECGGNGRSFFTPTARGNQWTNGGAGCAEWTGVRLSDVLKAAGVKSSAVFTGHYGSDKSLADGSKDALSRGVPIKKAMDGSNLIVFAMNGEPLPNIHGGPVRLVIAGWPGSVSAKWFTRLWVRDKYHDGPGMGATSYRVAIKPMVPRRQAGRRQLPRSRIDAGALDHHQPGERHQTSGRQQGSEAPRRSLGR
jgi:DMSO/TMAO reductase YedYZ molybdopterin-dependent catalytic subunit